MTLTRDQADLLIRYAAGWVFGDMVRNPAGGIAAAKQSMSGACTSQWWWSTDGKGVHATRTVGRDDEGRRVTQPVELPWTDVRRAIASIPADLASAVAAASKAHRQAVNHRVQPWGPGNRPVPWVAPPPEWEREALVRLKAACVAAIGAVSASGELALFEVPA